MAEKLRRKVEENVQIFKSKKIYVTLSLGVSEVKKGQQTNDAIKLADLRLYAAKEGGRNRVVASDS